MRRVALLVVLLGVLTVPAVGGAQAQTAPATPDTQIHITVQEDGDARWAVTVRFPLETENDTAAFETLRSEFTAGTAEETLSIEPFREAASRVSERTGQPMTITAVERTTSIRDRSNGSVGQLTLSFTWTNFAEIGEEEVRVGEAFEGGWFGDLGANQTLRIEPPAGYTVHTVEPSTAIANGTLRWEGPVAFEPGQPVVTFTPVGTGPLPFSIPVVAQVVLGAGLLVGVLAFVAWRREWFDAVATMRASSEDDAAAPSEPTPAVPSEEEKEEASGDTSGTGDGDSSETGESEPDPELLSDEERVERLLRENGGRMKQARIVEETRWSNAKVSQLLSAMAEEGRVEKLRLGRENLISLPDETE